MKSLHYSLTNELRHWKSLEAWTTFSFKGVSVRSGVDKEDSHQFNRDKCIFCSELFFEVFWDENEDFFFFFLEHRFVAEVLFLFLCRFLVHMEEAACVPHGATDWRCCDCVRSCRWLSAGKWLHTPRHKSSLLNTVPIMSHTR